MKQHVDVALLSEIHSRLQESTHEGTKRHSDKSDNSPDIEMVEMERPHCSTHPDELSSIERIHVQPTNPLPESSADELPSPRQGLQQTLQRTSDYLQMTLRPEPQHSSLYTPLMWLKSEQKKWKDRLENRLHAKRNNDNRFEIRENDESSMSDASEDQPTTVTHRELPMTVPRTEEQFETVRSHQMAAMHSELPATTGVKYETSDQRQQKQSMSTGASLEEAKTIHTAVEGETGRDLRQGQGMLKDDAGALEKKQGCSLNIQQTTRDDRRRRNRTKSADRGNDLQWEAESEDRDLEYVNVEYRGRGRRGKDGKSSKYVNVSLR